MQQSQLNGRSWSRNDETGAYMISTVPGQLDHDFISNMFTTDDLYWSGPITNDLLALMLSRSLNFGLYKVSSSSQKQEPNEFTTSAARTKDEEIEQIGLARFVTDYVTFIYITDVYIIPEHRGRGLGKWMMRCWEEVVRDMPQLRRALLLTSSNRTKSLYENGLGMWDSRMEGDQFHVMTRKRYESLNV